MRKLKLVLYLYLTVEVAYIVVHSYSTDINWFTIVFVTKSTLCYGTSDSVTPYALYILSSDFFHFNVFSYGVIIYIGNKYKKWISGYWLTLDNI